MLKHTLLYIGLAFAMLAMQPAEAQAKGEKTSKPVKGSS